eukprot:2836942-Karenia_brevis.AAC.1
MTCQSVTPVAQVALKCGCRLTVGAHDTPQRCAYRSRDPYMELSLRSRSSAIEHDAPISGEFS